MSINSEPKCLHRSGREPENSSRKIRPRIPFQELELHGDQEKVGLAHCPCPF